MFVEWQLAWFNVVERGPGASPSSIFQQLGPHGVSDRRLHAFDQLAGDSLDLGRLGHMLLSMQYPRFCNYLRFAFFHSGAAVCAQHLEQFFWGLCWYFIGYIIKLLASIILS